MSHLSEILLILFTLNLGTAFGAGLYETRLIIPKWFSKSTLSGYQVNREAMQEFDSGRKFWAFVTTGPLTLLMIANLILAWSSPSPGHGWWLAAGLMTLVERLVTFIFFIPTLIKVQKSDRLSPSQSNRLVTVWITLNYGRNLLTVLAWIAALLALVSLPKVIM